MKTPIVRVAIVDDDGLTRLAWELIDDPLLHLETYAAPDCFWEAARAEPSMLAALDAVITDYYFDDPPNSAQGPEFAAALKKQRPDLKIFLSSEVTLLNGLDTTFTGRIAKRRPDREMIFEALRN